MLRQIRSTSNTGNPKFVELKRSSAQRNLEWGEKAVLAMKTGGIADWTYIALVGGSDSMAFRIRVAQSHLRSDMLPSFWSEVLLLELKGETVAGARAVHVPLIQREPPEFATRTNGIVRRPLADFDDPERYPNIAIIALPVPQTTILKRLRTFSLSRSTLDALEHVLRWLAFAWGSARTPNPLHDNFGLPSACMLETLTAAEQLDLTPGLEARASCPEAIWAAARYWHEYYLEFRHEAPIGRYFTPHAYAIDEPKGSRIPSRKGR